MSEKPRLLYIVNAFETDVPVSACSSAGGLLGTGMEADAFGARKVESAFRWPTGG